MKRLLAAFDFSEEDDSTDSILRAVALLGTKGTSNLWVLHCYQAPIFVDAYSTVVNQNTEEERRAMDKLEHIRRGLEADGYWTAARFAIGDPGVAIVETAKSILPDCIVLGSHGHGRIQHLLLGSTTQYVLKHAKCPVFVMPLRASSPHISTFTRSSKSTPIAP